MTDERNQDPGPSLGRMILAMLAAVVLGVPMVAYLWETVHRVLSLDVEATRLLASLPVLALLLLLLRAVGRAFAAEGPGRRGAGG